MKFKKISMVILVILMIASIGLIVTSCKPKNTDDKNKIDQVIDENINYINKAETFETITEGMVNMGVHLSEKAEGKLNVNSKYEIQVSGINVEVTFEANYDIGRAQDSEFLLRVFDYQNHFDKMFVYYDGADLYYIIGERASKVEGFGSTSLFKIFYQVMKGLDFGAEITSERSINMIKAFNLSAVTKDITRYKLSESLENIDIKNINIDTSKDVVNNTIQKAIVPFGQKFDPITELLFGFKLSNLISFKVERLTVRKLATVIENKKDGSKQVNDVEIIFDDDEEGAPSWGTAFNDYRVAIHYSIKDNSVPLGIFDREKPDQVAYRDSEEGDMHFKGTLSIPKSDENFDADLRLSIDLVNNANNRIILDVSDKSVNQGQSYSVNEEMMMFYFKNGSLYINSAGFLHRYIKHAVDYEALNLDKIQFNDIDLSLFLNSSLLNAVRLFSEGISIEGITNIAEGVPTAFGALMANTRSEGNRVIFKIDDNLITKIMGDSAGSLISQASKLLGLTEEQINMILALGIFNTSYLEVSYDTITKEIRMEVYANNEVLFVLSLYAQELPDTGVNMTFPDEINPDYFEEYKIFKKPEVVNFEIDSKISTHAATAADISALMGVFMGDVSGKNTHMILGAGTNNQLRVLGNIATRGQDLFVKLDILKGDTVLVRLNTDMSSPKDVLVDNKMLDVKYKMGVGVIIAGLSKLSADGGVFEFNNIIEYLPKIAKEGQVKLDGDYININMFPYTKNRVVVDPIKDITGVPGLISFTKAKITFELPNINESAAGYVNPVINVPGEVYWQGMYDAKWLEKATVVFGDVVKEYYLTFEGESAKLITGKYEYHPESSLFGLKISYSMYFTDDVNGTRKVQYLKSSYLEIDPVLETPIPEKIAVVYEDGRQGSLAYKIIGFPYNNQNIKQIYSGAPMTRYEVVIGEGSIGETRFELFVEVKNSTIVVSENDYYNNTPIVARVTIDPYDYSIKHKKALETGSTYNPIRYRKEGEGELSPTTLELTFLSNNRNSTDLYRKEYIENFDWGFNLSNITFTGGLYMVEAYYHNLKIALEVTVLAKIVSYIQINDENRGYYTVDALRQSTYTIPTTTIMQEEATATLPANEMRVYFESGHFRIIGNKNEYTVKESEEPFYDGIYPGSIDWRFKVANQVTVDRAIYPLDNGRTDKTTAQFGDVYAGKQQITLTVVCPTRVVSTQADSLLAITEITYGANGEIIEDVTRKEAVKVSNGAFAKESAIGSFFEFDPYSEDISNTRLPSTVWIDAVYRGRMQRLGYPVTWLTNLDGTPDNIIDEQGNILNVFAEEEFFAVYGRIGTATNYQILTMIIHNKSGEYERVVMLDEANQPFEVEEEVRPDNTIHYNIRNLNPYEKLVLPHAFILKFSANSGIPDTRYIAQWETESGENALTHKFPFHGGMFTVYTKLSAQNETGMLDQTIPLNLYFAEKVVVSDMIFGVTAGMAPGSVVLEEFQQPGGGTISVPYVAVDTYSAISKELLLSLSDPNIKVGVQFTDETNISTGITIAWDNLEEVLNALKSPLGSIDKYNEAEYLGNFIRLRGRIEPGTVQEQNISMAFRIGDKIIRDMDFPNLNRQYSIPDEFGTTTVELSKTLKKIVHDEVNDTYSYVGNNTINIVLNKPYALIGNYTNENGESKTGIVTPSQYINYLLSRVAVGFEGDIPGLYAMHFVLREDFDEILFFKRTASDYAGDPSVAISDSHATITFNVTKLGIGSCEQSFTVTVTAVYDRLEFSTFSERVETFDKNGVPIYGGIDGYTIPDEFLVKYEKSGEVKYSGLAWTAIEAMHGENEAIIEIGDRVLNIPYTFFKFVDGSGISLEAVLQDGQKITRRINFNKKNINKIQYNTTGTGIYDIKDGVLLVSNVYEFYPVENLQNKLSTVIIPKSTSEFYVDGAQEFTLDGIGWIPSEHFAKDDNPLEFDNDKLATNINYRGLNRVLFAKASVTGYNGESQVIELYIRVVAQASGGKVFNESINLAGTNAVIDPYNRPETENGVLVIPKNLTIRFGEPAPDQAVFTFAQNSNTTFEIRDVINNVFVPISQITYDKFGHTMGANYGSRNARMHIRITLPDGNNSVSFEIEFLNRELERVFYKNVATENYPEIEVEGRYYIDPYDMLTHKLPREASFKFRIYEERVTLPITLTPADNSSPFEQINGEWVLRKDVTTYTGGTHFFYGYLKGIGEADSPQYYILAVIILDRTIATLPSAITDNGGVFTFSGVNGFPTPFEGLVSDIPSSLVDATFTSLSLTNASAVSGLNNTVNIINALLGSTGITISHYAFNDQSSVNLYLAYTSARNPVTPTVLWFKDGVELVNDDILTRGGFYNDLVGKIGYGEGLNRTYGEEVDLQIRAENWDFVDILDLPSTGGIIDFNRYTNLSIQEQFSLSFVAGPPGGQTTRDPLIFYPLDSRLGNDTGKLRRVIDWGGVDPDSNEASAIILRNMFKLLPENRIVSDDVYNLDYKQIAVDEISFGFGADEGFNSTGNVYLIIDPLNPKFPTTAIARGQNPYNTSEIITIGTVNIDWLDKDTKSSSSIYNIKVGGGLIPQVAINITDSTEQNTPFTVKVYYLNRVVRKVYTKERGYSTLPADSQGNFLLMERGINNGAAIPSNKTHHIQIDPVNPNLYVEDSSIITNLRYRESGEIKQSLYKMPNTIELEFYRTHQVNTSMTEAIYNEAIDKLGQNLTLSNVSWLFSRDISLEPATAAKPISSSIRGYNAKTVIGGVTATSDYIKIVPLASDGSHPHKLNEIWVSDSLDLSVQSLDRTVRFTSISEEVEAIKDGVVVFFQKAKTEYYIDPYNVKLPDTVNVNFKDQAQPITYGSSSDPINWEYDRNYLSRSDVISGTIGPTFMVIMASFRAFGAKVYIQFEIRARHIETSITLPGGQQTTEPLKGGTIYVLKGVELAPQLPTKLYYRFDYLGHSEIAAAPLTFSENSLAGISTAIAVTDVELGGRYTGVSATLGTIDDDNILFDIVVIDPKLYSIRTVTSTIGGTSNTITTFRQGNFISDIIAVSVSRSNIYAPGPEQTLLPERIVITKDGDYIEIDNIRYDIANMKAYVDCSYSFLSFADSPRLFGNSSLSEEESKKLKVTFEVPISKYIYTAIEIREAEFNVRSYTVPLGTIIKASELPKMKNGIQPLWVLDEVNTNRAGTYTAKCYFKNAYGAIIEGSLPIIVQKKGITNADVKIAREFLDRTYTGRALDLSNYITFEEFLREDGSFGALEGYTIQYSIDGGETWMSTQPINVPEVGSPSYSMRIIINEADDYNYTGFVAFRLVIKKAQVVKENIFFHKGDNIPITPATGEEYAQATFEYTGTEQIPLVAGIPEGVLYQLTFARYIQGQTPDYSTTIRPINAGLYIMTIKFSEDQRNYDIQENVTYSILVKIDPKTVVYSLESILPYTGMGFNVPINGLPNPLPADVIVTYTYKYQNSGIQLPQGSRIRDAGIYLVSVTIDGGINYPNFSISDYIVEVFAKEIMFKVGDLSSDYLEELQALNSNLSVVDFADNTLPGLQGTDDIGIFRDIIISWTDGLLTRKHMVGEYPIHITNLGAINHRNYIIKGQIAGTYRITAVQANTRVVDNKTQLDDIIGLLKDGDTLRLYLRAGHYGTITLNKNASVSIVGSYDLSGQTDEIAVTFDRINLQRGALLLDIVKMRARANTSLIEVGTAVANITIRRSEFIDPLTLPPANAGDPRLTTENSNILKTDALFKGTVYMEETKVIGFATGLYLAGGSVEMSNSSISYTIIGVHLMKGNAIISENSFSFCRNVALRIDNSRSTVSIFENTFSQNSVGIRSTVTLRNDIKVQNNFVENALDVKSTNKV